MKEIWKDIPGYEGHYQVSNLGNVKSLERVIKRSGVRGDAKIKGGQLIPKVDKKGYYALGLSFNKKRKCFKVHQLVTMAFLGHTPNGMIDLIDHIDENKLNNNLLNLRITNNRDNTSKGKLKYNKSSEYTGVYKNKSRKKLKNGELKIYDNFYYHAQITINNKRIYLAATKDELEAKKIYDTALKNISLFNGDAVEFRKKIKQMI
jgi:hypothetical protein